ncbi:MAG: hypothetical protein OSJ72_10140 [Lachnospiraceae bacterium]|nr:hypothetical protein [Lachnospiraceae bacterium]
MSFISWEDYKAISAEVPEEEFKRLRRKAEIKMNAVTHMRAGRFLSAYGSRQATEFQRQVYEQIQATMCELIDALYTRETSDMGTGISSVSNDGYSETYHIKTETEMEAQMVSLIRNGLSGTGLAGAI